MVVLEDLAKRPVGDDDVIYFAQAQVHALLAIMQELRSIATELNTLNCGGYDSSTGLPREGLDTLF
jgi:hypothetical protein